MGKYVPTCDEEFEFNDLLRRVDAPTNLNNCAAINTFVRRKLKVHQLWVAERVGWYALNELVNRHEEGPKKPLLAARILLGVYEYPSDPKVSIGPNRPPLRDYWPTAQTLSGPSWQRRVVGLTMRQTIAAAESGFGGGNDLSGNTRKLPVVSEALWVAFEEYISGLTEQQARRLIKEAKASGPSGGVVKHAKPKRPRRAEIATDDVKMSSSVLSGDNRMNSVSRWVDESRFSAWLISLSGMVSLTGLSVVLSLAAFILLPPLVTPPVPPVTETKVLTYMPTYNEIVNAARDPSELVNATCAPSFSSLRRDALSCALEMDVRRFLDPCFLVSTDRVSCPNAMDMLMGTGMVGNQAKVTDHVDATWSLSDGRVGISSAEDSLGPWLFELNKTSQDGIPLSCRVALVATANFDGPAYNCATGNNFPDILAASDNQIFSSGSQVQLAYLNQILAGDLDRSTEPWTVEVVDPARNTTERVAVIRAWF